MAVLRPDGGGDAAVTPYRALERAAVRGPGAADPVTDLSCRHRVTGSQHIYCHAPPGAAGRRHRTGRIAVLSVLVTAYASALRSDADVWSILGHSTSSSEVLHARRDLRGQRHARPGRAA